MREIEYRGKRTDSGGWVYGYYYPDMLDATHGKMVTWAFIKQYHNGEKAIWEVEKETVGQYTGLKDENGYKIYEGDIIVFTLGDYQTRGEVIKDYGCFSIKFDDLDNEKLETNTDCGNLYRGLYVDNYLSFIEIIWNFEPQCEGYLDTIEIIGNIHENKE